MSRVLPMYRREVEGEVIERIYVTSTTARERNTSSFHTIRVGVKNGTGVDWLGKYDGSANDLNEGEAFLISGEAELNWWLAEDDVIVVEHTSPGVKAGEPGVIDGIGVEVKGRVVGAVDDTVYTVRADGDYPPPAGMAAPLFTVAGNIPDEETRSAVEAIVNRLEDSPATRWQANMALYAETRIPVATPMDHDSDESHSDSGVSVGTSHPNYTSSTNVSVTVTIPSGYTTGEVQVVASATADGASGAEDFYMRINDGTNQTAHMIEGTAGDGEYVSCTCTDAATITANTTFTPEYATGGIGGNITVVTESITFHATFRE